VDDVYATCAKLEQQGCRFKKKPDEGRMKGLAFVYGTCGRLALWVWVCVGGGGLFFVCWSGARCADGRYNTGTRRRLLTLRLANGTCNNTDPDGYWVEIVKRSDTANIPNEYNFSQTMLRVKDPLKSVAFYRKLGMKVLDERHFADFSLFFLGSSTVPDGAAVKDLFLPVLELTHNHGTESKSDFVHYNGNEADRQGFGHVGFLVDDVYGACDALRSMGYGFRKEPDGGSMKGLAFAYDPDGYSVELIPRGGLDFGDVRKDQ
jgi:lactoylglutathione lyase